MADLQRSAPSLQWLRRGPRQKEEIARRRSSMKQLISRQLPQERTQSGPSRVDAIIPFGRFRVLLRQRQLIADGVPIELGTRAFDLLLALLEADGSLVTKGELLGRVWPGIVVAVE